MTIESLSYGTRLKLFRLRKAYNLSPHTVFPIDTVFAMIVGQGLPPLLQMGIVHIEGRIVLDANVIPHNKSLPELLAFVQERRKTLVGSYYNKQTSNALHMLKSVCRNVHGGDRPSEDSITPSD